MISNTRDLLLVIYAIVWGTITVLTVWRTKDVPNELLAALGVGVGTILAAFRADDYAGRRRAVPPPDPTTVDPEDRT